MEWDRIIAGIIAEAWLQSGSQFLNEHWSVVIHLRSFAGGYPYNAGELLTSKG